MSAAVLAFAPLLIKFLSFLFDKFGASAEAKKLMAELIRLSNNDGLISVKISDEQLDQDAQLKKLREKAAQDDKNPKT